VSTPAIGEALNHISHNGILISALKADSQKRMNSGFRISGSPTRTDISDWENYCMRSLGMIGAHILQ